MPLPDELDIDNALIFFHAYMYGPLRGKMRLYRARDISPRMVMSEDWELFASILVRDRGAPGHSGLDLQGCEVKSAKDNGSFEYQYHRNSWQEKLAADREADHIFISHEDGLRLVEVRYCEGALMQRFFDAWEEEGPYSKPEQQRFRKQVPSGWVRDNASLLLRLVDGEVEGEPDS